MQNHATIALSLAAAELPACGPGATAKPVSGGECVRLEATAKDCAHETCATDTRTDLII